MSDTNINSFRFRTPSEKKSHVQIVTAFLLLLYFTLPHHAFFLFGFPSTVKPADVISILLVASVMLVGRLSKEVIIFIYLAAWYLFCSIINNLQGAALSLLFPMKLLQYSFILAAISYLTLAQRRKLFNQTVLTTVLLIGLELLGFNIGLNWGERVSAQYGGPYELSAILLVIIFFLPREYSGYWFLIIAAFIALFLTDTKASYLAILIWLSMKAFYNLRQILLFTALIMIVGTVTVESRVFDLVESMADFDWSFMVRTLWTDLPHIRNTADYTFYWEQREAAQQGLDLSTWSRLYTYLLVFKSVSVSTMLYGNGPGFYGMAVDSSLLRIFAETGFVGLLLMSVFVRRLAKAAHVSNFTLGFLLIVLLSDVFFSSRFLAFVVLLTLICRDFNFEKNSYSK